jgi:outer membrane biosynthesis protein TonB
MKKFGPSFLLSILLHVGLVLLVFVGWISTPKPLKVSSVPVTVISDMPSRQMAEAPVDELAVKTPEPIPQPEPVPPQPTPAPPQPVPTPIKPAAKPIPTPPKPAPVPPDKNGLKKPEPTPVKKPVPMPAKPTPKKEDDFLTRMAATPSQAPTRRAPSASTQKTTGQSAVGSGPADAGLKTEMNALTQRLNKLWIFQCDVPGSREVVAEIRFTLSPNGRVIEGPVWLNKRNDPVWVAQASLAMAAVNKGQPNAYLDLPAGLYNRPLKITFDAQKACVGH